MSVPPGPKWPKTERDTRNDPRYPVYVVSKGRSESLITARYLDRMGVPFRLVVEPPERDAYAAAMERSAVTNGTILTLPFADLGQGSIPARNWIWDHAQAAGAARHWILDDNIEGFMRYNRNAKRYVWTGAIFQAAEDFTDRYTNVLLSGFQYDFFVPRRQKQAPLIINTRVYSCILIATACPFRWRGRYNEDTDLSLRVLKSGACTILFNAFLAKKIATMRCKGGNTAELYKQDEQFDGRLEMARSLVRQHPDVVTIVRRWGRWQHLVDYRPFKNNKLIRRPGCEVPEGTDEYGMALANPE